MRGEWRVQSLRSSHRIQVTSYLLLFTEIERSVAAQYISNMQLSQCCHEGQWERERDHIWHPTYSPMSMRLSHHAVTSFLLLQRPAVAQLGAGNSEEQYNRNLSVTWYHFTARLQSLLFYCNQSQLKHIKRSCDWEGDWYYWQVSSFRISDPVIHHLELRRDDDRLESLQTNICRYLDIDR